MLDSNGATTSVVPIVFDGAQSWTAANASCQTNVAHTSSADLKARAEGLGQWGSLADFLALYINGNPHRCRPTCR